MQVRQPTRTEFIQVIDEILVPTFPETERPSADGILKLFDKGVINPLVMFVDDQPVGTAVGIWSRRGKFSFDDDETHHALDEFSNLDEFADPNGVDDPEAVTVTVPSGDEIALSDLPKVVLLNWLAIGRRGRGGGYGSKLLKEAIRIWEEKFNPVLIFAEVEDPAVHSGSEEFGDPEARIRFYKRNGARRIDTPFLIPRFMLDEDVLDGMIPIAVGGRALPSVEENGLETPGEPFGEEFAEFLHEYVEYSNEPRDEHGQYEEAAIRHMLREAPKATLA